MRRFWGYYDNGKYRVGCNGQTVYVYDQNNKELARFKDIIYAYSGKFLPGKNIIIIKSTEGSLAVYDLDKLELIKKIIITRIGAQDEGFTFSPDGKRFYNIEKPTVSTETQLTIYQTSDFTVAETLFADRTDLVLSDIEFDEESEQCYILGFMRNHKGTYDYGFIGQLVNNEIINIKKLDYDAFDYIEEYKKWESSGFTDRQLEWSMLKDKEKIVPITLRDEWKKRKS